MEAGPHHPSRLHPRLGQFAHLWGVFAGGCIAGTEAVYWRNTDGHAHVDLEDPWQGWICVADPTKVLTPKGNPSTLLLHELAHLLTGQSHGKAFQAACTVLGIPREGEHYRRRQD